MHEALALFEKSIQKAPGQWLWQHNRWKQQPHGNLRRIYRQDSLAILLPKEKSLCASLLPHLQTFRTLYPTEFILVIAPNDIEIPVDAD